MVALGRPAGPPLPGRHGGKDLFEQRNETFGLLVGDEMPGVGITRRRVCEL